MFGKKINATRVWPVTLKIVLIFGLFILISNFSSNYINLLMNRSEQLALMNQLLTGDLKNLYSYCNDQYEILQYDRDRDESLRSIERKGAHELKNSKALFLGFEPDGDIIFLATGASRDGGEKPAARGRGSFPDSERLAAMNRDLRGGKDEGPVSFIYRGEEYFGMYKYNPLWGAFVVRAEELNQFYARSRSIFWKVGVVIIFITIVVGGIGVFILRYILRYIEVITGSIMRMVKTQRLALIDMKDATNDDITYLGMAFNSLSTTVDNLIAIFRKFANKDVVLKAYRDRIVKLEGSRYDLTVLFSDIRSFTFITETLGTEIIKLLNLHYDRAIREIVDLDGVMGAIIGDALLAVFGVLEESPENKSLRAVTAGYRLHEITEELRRRMTAIREQIERERGALTEEEERIYRAVLLEIGVGIDGGEIFYGNIGSYVRMTNTVIGDPVNSASRLEGLTRIYRVPVICSEYVKDDIEAGAGESGYRFVEIDTVLVKGKTEGRKIFWPVRENEIDDGLSGDIAVFEKGRSLYYRGEWDRAAAAFRKCGLPLAEVFRERTRERPPEGWDGIWEMTTK